MKKAGEYNRQECCDEHVGLNGNADNTEKMIKCIDKETDDATK